MFILKAWQVGTYGNEVLTPTYILDTISSISKAAPLGVEIEAEVQRPSGRLVSHYVLNAALPHSLLIGAFSTAFIGGFTNVYSNVTNIVVRISHSPEAKVLPASCNCHNIISPGDTGYIAALSWACFPVVLRSMLFW